MSDYGREVARQVARYYIGDATWADTIIHAYENPDTALHALQEDMEDER